MSTFEWTVVLLLGAMAAIGIASWMTHLSFAVGKVIAELHSINDKLGGQLEWIKSLDAKSDDHEKRIARLENHQA